MVQDTWKSQTRAATHFVALAPTAAEQEPLKMKTTKFRTLWRNIKMLCFAELDERYPTRMAVLKETAALYNRLSKLERDNESFSKDINAIYNRLFKLEHARESSMSPSQVVLGERMANIQSQLAKHTLLLAAITKDITANAKSESNIPPVQ